MGRPAHRLVARTSDPEVFVDGSGCLVFFPDGCVCGAQRVLRWPEPAHSPARERAARLPIAESPAFNRDLYPEQDCIPLCPTKS